MTDLICPHRDSQGLGIDSEHSRSWLGGQGQGGRSRERGIGRSGDRERERERYQSGDIRNLITSTALLYQCPLPLCEKNINRRELTAEKEELQERERAREREALKEQLDSYPDHNQDPVSPTENNKGATPWPTELCSDSGDIRWKENGLIEIEVFDV